jgi:hypothetical protein
MLHQHPVQKMAVISAALSALNTIPILLPAGETSCVQVLDVGNQPFINLDMAYQSTDGEESNQGGSRTQPNIEDLLKIQTQSTEEQCSSLVLSILHVRTKEPNIEFYFGRT